MICSKELMSWCAALCLMVLCLFCQQPNFGGRCCSQSTLAFCKKTKKNKKTLIPHPEFEQRKDFAIRKELARNVISGFCFLRPSSLDDLSAAFRLLRRFDILDRPVFRLNFCEYFISRCARNIANFLTKHLN